MVCTHTLREQRGHGMTNKFAGLLWRVCAGADVDAIDATTGTSLLHRAVHHSTDPFVTQFLLQVGANTAHADVSGATPLHLAAELEGCEAHVDALLQVGADVNVQDGGAFWLTLSQCIMRMHG